MTRSIRILASESVGLPLSNCQPRHSTKRRATCLSSFPCSSNVKTDNETEEARTITQYSSSDGGADACGTHHVLPFVAGPDSNGHCHGSKLFENRYTGWTTFRFHEAPPSSKALFEASAEPNSLTWKDCIAKDEKWFIE
ncbi:hypothetical protein APHAL10511_005386 [Amanita phalloides]|nr:hypothetical protein APHAL10511_005386 [Amanita phalloides]